jgi:ABC-2 type transport system ATP-binding protein
MTQRFSLYEDLSVHENLEFLGRVQSLPRHRRRRRIPQQLRDFDLEELEDQRAGTLSGGQRQRLALAAATLHEPELLLLDEPTSAVDPQSRRDFWEQLFVMIDHGTTILVSTHFMDEAERCHKLAILDHGRLVAAGRPRDLIEQIGVTVVEIETDRPRSAHRCLDGLAAIRSVAQLGTRLHALVDPAYDNIIEDLDRIFRDAGISASSAVTRANLEDVFVEATRPTAPTASSESPS